MLIFVDFDNLPSLLKGRPIRDICSACLSACATLQIPKPTRARFRLYGGWFDFDRKTKRAMTLAADQDIRTPFMLPLPWGNQSAAVNITAELAYSLESDPRTDLYATFRYRSFTDRVHCDKDLSNKCVSQTCSLKVVESFFMNQRCPTSGCGVQQSEFLRKAEQKLVDTMIVSDLLYHTRASPDLDLVIISSDDDMWPGIRTATALGKSVAHIHTRASSAVSHKYRSSGPGAYLTTSL